MTVTPRERKRQRSRAGILTAARDLVLEKGPDMVSLREIAARAGFSPASLYEYFASKEEILEALAADVGARLHARLAAVPGTLSPPRRLVRLGEAYLAFARENPADYLLVFSHLRSRRRGTHEALPPASPFGIVRDAVAAGLACGAFAPRASAEDLAYGLWALVHGAAMLQATHLRAFEADFEAADRAALDAFVVGLAQPR